MSGNTPLLEVEHLKKYFKTKRGMLHAVDDVSFTLGRGKTLGVVGESGCGKSTLGRTILHLLGSTSGTIRFDGQDITKVNRRELNRLRTQMQIIFQDPFSSLNPRMTVGEAIAEPLILTRNLKGSDLEKEIRELMDMVGLADRLYNTYPHELDGGRRQRIGIARAMSVKPSFIVCDEPVSALDVSIQAQILNLMLDLQETNHLTYMFITHDMSVVKYISDEIAVMYLGQVVEKSPADELFANPMHPYTKALLSAIPRPDVHDTTERIVMKGELTSPIDPAPGCRFASRCPYATEKCHEPQVLREVSPRHFLACHMAENAIETRIKK